MVKRIFNISESLAKALRKGAHKKEESQTCLIIRALVNELRKIDDEDVQNLVDNHEANVDAEREEKLKPRAPKQAI